MTQPPSASSGGAAPLSLVQRFFGVLTSPKATYESVVSFPRWVGMLVLTTAITLVVVGAFMFTSVGHDIIVQQGLARGQTAEQAEMGATIGQYIAPVFILVFSPLLTLAAAGILLGVFAITGGTASFKQVLAVWVHSGVVPAVAGIVNTAVNYFRATDVNITSLAGLSQAFGEKSFLANFISTFDLVTLWWLFVLAVGLAVLYRRRTQNIFLALMGVHVVISLAVAAVKGAFGG